MSWKVGIIGTGNLAAFWAKNLVPLANIQVFCKGSSPEKTQEFNRKFGCLPWTNTDRLDFVIVAVQDDKIDSVIDALSLACPLLLGSGIYTRKRRNEAVVYPLQTLHKDQLPNLSEVPFLVDHGEGNNENLVNFLKDIKASVTFCSQDERQKVHLCAVFINNFGYFIMRKGLEMRPNNLDPQLFDKLIQYTTLNVLKSGTLQTGPALRKDIKTMEKHVSLLNAKDRELYAYLSEQIIQNSHAI
jgi:hypothetical protein